MFANIGLPRLAINISDFPADARDTDRPGNANSLSLAPATMRFLKLLHFWV